MLRLLGSVLLMAGAVGVALGLIGKLTARLALLRALVQALEWVERELLFRLTPMSVLLKTLAERKESPAAPFFGAVYRGMAHLNETPLSRSWSEAAEEHLAPLTDEERAVVSGLGLILGRYDGEAQRAALGQAVETLKVCCGEAKSEKLRLGKVYGVLGVTAGMFLVVLLL